MFSQILAKTSCSGLFIMTVTILINIMKRAICIRGRNFAAFCDCKLSLKMHGAHVLACETMNIACPMKSGGYSGSETRYVDGKNSTITGLVRTLTVICANPARPPSFFFLPSHINTCTLSCSRTHGRAVNHAERRLRFGQSQSR